MHQRNHRSHVFLLLWIVFGTLVSLSHPLFLFYLAPTDIVMEEAPPTPNAATQPQVPPTMMPYLPPSLAPDRDAGRRGVAGVAGGSRGGERLGLTKEVLSVHTQQAEQSFMCRFRDLSKLRVFDSSSAVRRQATVPLARGEDVHKRKRQSTQSLLRSPSLNLFDQKYSRTVISRKPLCCSILFSGNHGALPFKRV